MSSAPRLPFGVAKHAADRRRNRRSDIRWGTTQQLYQDEGQMSERRSHSRFVLEHSGGLLRVLRDVIVITRPNEDEVIAFSDEPGVAGENLTLELMVNGRMTGIPCRVAESRLVMREGAVKHCLRLVRLDGSGSDAVDATSDEPEGRW